MKKLLVIVSLGVIVNLNAGMVDFLSGPNTYESEYESKERGIIVNQDVDADGIIDSKDDCLESNPCTGKNCQKEEVKVIKPIGDKDKDGVLDNLDKCPQTPIGFEVDNQGCSVLVNLEVKFDNDKYDIKTDFTQKLDTFANFMLKHENFKAQIQGHTDSNASEEYNQVLSQNRANKVKEYLVNKGIEENRLESVGYGELQAIDTNETLEGRANNRRVVAVLKK